MVAILANVALNAVLAILGRLTFLIQIFPVIVTFSAPAIDAWRMSRYRLVRCGVHEFGGKRQLWAAFEDRTGHSDYNALLRVDYQNGQSDSSPCVTVMSKSKLPVGDLGLDVFWVESSEIQRLLRQHGDEAELTLASAHVWAIPCYGRGNWRLKWRIAG